MPLRDFVAEHRADRAVDVSDRQIQLNRRPMLDRAGAQRQQRVVERLVESMILGANASPPDAVWHIWLIENLRQVDTLGLPVVDCRLHVQPIDSADHLVNRSEAHLRHQLPDFLGQESEEVLDELRFA